MHAHEVHAHEICAGEMHAREVHTYEMHAHEVHAYDKIAKCTCENAYSAPSHNLYGTHENSIPFLHCNLAAAHFTSLSLLNRETCQIFGCLSIARLPGVIGPKCHFAPK